MRYFISLLLGLSLLAIHSCSSVQVTNLEVINSKDGQIIYRVDAVEDTFFSTRQVQGLLCVPDSSGDLLCR